MRKGFTLAEVLITLGIIGIVAAMTMPTLIQKHRKQVVETRLSKFYSVINQAIIASEVDNGAKENWEFPSDSLSRIEWFNKYLSKYIKTVKVTNSDINTQAITPIQIYFADGSAVVIGQTWIFFPEAKDMIKKQFSDENNIYLDVEQSGRKWFTFTFEPVNPSPFYYKKGLEPYVVDWNGTKENLYNHPVLGCKKQIGGTDERAFCTKLIQMNGWKIPDDYPLKF